MSVAHKSLRFALREDSALFSTRRDRFSDQSGLLLLNGGFIFVFFMILRMIFFRNSTKFLFQQFFVNSTDFIFPEINFNGMPVLILQENISKDTSGNSSDNSSWFFSENTSKTSSEISLVIPSNIFLLITLEISHGILMEITIPMGNFLQVFPWYPFTSALDSSANLWEFSW